MTDTNKQESNTHDHNIIAILDEQAVRACELETSANRIECHPYVEPNTSFSTYSVIAHYTKHINPTDKQVRHMISHIANKHTCIKSNMC